MSGSIYYDMKPHKIFIWGVPPCSNAGPWKIGEIMEPGNDNPLFYFFKPLGVDIIKQILNEADKTLGLWRDIFGRL